VAEDVPPDGPILTVGGDSAERLGLVYFAGRKVVDLAMLGGPSRTPAVRSQDAVERWLSAVSSSSRAWAFAEVFTEEGAERALAAGIPRLAWHRAIGSLVRGQELTLPADGKVRKKEFRLVEVRASGS
jgi:hypothetical protein